jgi:hypothetical protein
MPLTSLLNLAVFGQASAPPDGAIGLPLTATLAIGLGILAVLAVILVPTVLGLRYAKVERELEHAERIRALELGQSLPKDAPFWSPARLSAAIGAGVPISVFGTAFVTTIVDGNSYDGFIWSSAGAVGLAGVICGTILAARVPAREASPVAPRHAFNGKLESDPDAYDVAGRRG